MCPKNISGVDIITRLSVTTIAPDGYIRLTFEELQQIPFVHLISGIDEDNTSLLRKGVTFTEITGYTEWISTTCPAISIGWDWIIHFPQEKGGYCYKRTSEPKSNLMLIDAQQRDLGTTETSTLIETVVDEFIWQTVVQSHISKRYTS